MTTEFIILWMQNTKLLKFLFTNNKCVYIYGNIEKLSTTITYNFHKQLHFVINLFSVEAMCKGIIFVYVESCIPLSQTG